MRTPRLGCAAIAGFALLGACGKSGSSGSAASKPKLEFPVEVAPIVTRQVGYVVNSPGTINAFEQVQVTSRVGGAVDKVQFTEGQSVEKDQVLAVIEVDRYQVAVDQARAALAKSQASEAQAEAQLARRQGATAEHPGLIPGEELATYQTGVQTAKADLAAAGEALKIAQLNLRDAHVRAPISGVIQSRTVETGQYLTPGTVLATLLQRDPLLLKFQVTEADAPRIKPGMTAELALRESARKYEAKVTLVAGAADPQSHLVSVTAEVDDKEHKYWLRPGAFCDVTVPIQATRSAVVVPQLSIRASEKGFLAYVVEGTAARERVLTLGMHTPDGRVEVTQGLKAGELLVVRGAEPLSEGAQVKIAARSSLDDADAGVAPPPGAVAAEKPAGEKAE